MQHDVGVHVLVTVNVALQDTQERRVVDFGGLLTDELWLDRDFRAAEMSAAEKDGVSFESSPVILMSDSLLCRVHDTFSATQQCPVFLTRPGLAV